MTTITIKDENSGLEVSVRGIPEQSVAGVFDALTSILEMNANPRRDELDTAIAQLRAENVDEDESAAALDCMINLIGDERPHEIVANYANLIGARGFATWIKDSIQQAKDEEATHGSGNE